MTHESKELSSHILDDTYHTDEKSFQDNIMKVPVHEVDKKSDITTSHVIYNIKMLYDR